MFWSLYFLESVWQCDILRNWCDRPCEPSTVWGSTKWRSKTGKDASGNSREQLHGMYSCLLSDNFTFKPRREKTGLWGFWPGTTQTGLCSHRGWLEASNFGFKKELYYYCCSKNKVADQLRSYCKADLRLCFRIGKNQVFSWRGSYMKYGFC